MTKDELIAVVLLWHDADIAMRANQDSREGAVDSIIQAADADKALAQAVAQYRAEMQ